MLNYHNEIKAAFGLVSPALTGRQLFRGMMTHQKRANAVLTTANSCSGVGHLCAWPASCRNSPVQTSIRRQRLEKKTNKQKNQSARRKTPTASVRDGQAQRRRGQEAPLEGARKSCVLGFSFRKSIKKLKRVERVSKPRVELYQFQ